MSDLNDRVSDLQLNVINKRIKHKDAILKHKFQSHDMEIDILKKTKIIYDDDSLKINVPEIQIDKDFIKTLRSTKVDTKKVIELEDRMKHYKGVLKQLSQEKNCPITKQMMAIDELL